MNILLPLVTAAAAFTVSGVPFARDGLRPLPAPAGKVRPTGALGPAPKKLAFTPEDKERKHKKKRA